MSCTKALKKEQHESAETTIRKLRLLFAGNVQRTHNERLSRRVIIWTMAGEENPGPGPTRKELGPMSSRRPQGVWSRRGIHGTRLLLVFQNGAMAHGGKKVGKWFRGSGVMFHGEVEQGRCGE